MNTQPIDTALDADLRLSQQALQRAARRARELAKQTGTAIVVCHHNRLELLDADQATQTPATQQPDLPYRHPPGPPLRRRSISNNSLARFFESPEKDTDQREEALRDGLGV